MMPSPRQNELHDAICAWLDEIIPILEQRECLKWPHERDITLPEAVRGALFDAVKRVVFEGGPKSSRIKSIKFPSSAIARVQNAISHLSQFRIDEVTPRSVVFMPMSVMEVAQQVPVAQALAEIDKSYTFVLKNPNAALEMGLTDVDVLPHSRALQSHLSCARLRARVMWLRLGREEHFSLPKLNFAFKEIDLSDIVLETILNCVTAVFEAHALATFVIESVRPRLIVVSNEIHPKRRVIVATAKRFGVRCIDLMGHIEESAIDTYRLCDRFVVFGNFAKRALAASGIDTKKIKTCGTPYLDAIALAKPLLCLTKTEVRKEAKGHVAMFDIDERWAAALSRISSQTPHLFFLYLTNKAGALFQRYLKQTSNFRICQKQNLSSSRYAACLKSADVFVTDKLRVALEAMSLGKRVIAFDFDEAFDDRDFLKSGLTRVARDVPELLRVISSPDENRVDEYAQRWSEDYFSRKDGQSGARVASVIVEECQK